MSGELDVALNLEASLVAITTLMTPTVLSLHQEELEIPFS